MIQFYPDNKMQPAMHLLFQPGRQPHLDMTFNDAMALLDILTDNGIKNTRYYGGEHFSSLTHGFHRQRTLQRHVAERQHKREYARPASRAQSGTRDHFNIGISLEGSTAEKHNRLTGSHNFAPAIKASNV
jgi:hypothetical protein